MWENAVSATSFEVLGVESIDANDDCWLYGEAIGTTVEFN